MARALLLSMLIAALGGGVYVASGVVRIHSPSAPLVEEESQAQTAAATTNFASAATALQAWFAANGTYAGAILPDASGVTVARAGSTGSATPPLRTGSRSRPTPSSSSRSSSRAATSASSP